MSWPLSSSIRQLILRRNFSSEATRPHLDDEKDLQTKGEGLPSGKLSEKSGIEVNSELREMALAEVLRMYPTLGKLSDGARANVELFLQMGATPQEVGMIFKGHSNLLQRNRGRLSNPTVLAGKAAILKSYGLKSRTFISLCLFPSGLLTRTLAQVKELLQFLVEEVHVQDLEAAFHYRSILLRLSLPKIRKCLQNLQVAGLQSKLDQLKEDPSALRFDPQKMSQNHEDLRTLLGDPLKSRVLTFPSLLCLPHEVLVSRVKNIRAVTGWKDAESVISRSPNTLGAHERTLCATLKFFEDTFGREDVLPELRKHPNLLLFRTHTLKPKVDFVLGTMGFDRKELLRSIWILAFSLEGRLKPRYNTIKAVDSSLRPPLYTFRDSDQKFARYIDDIKSRRVARTAAA